MQDCPGDCQSVIAGFILDSRGGGGGTLFRWVLFVQRRQASLLSIITTVSLCHYLKQAGDQIAGDVSVACYQDEQRGRDEGCVSVACHQDESVLVLSLWSR